MAPNDAEPVLLRQSLRRQRGVYGTLLVFLLLEACYAVFARGGGRWIGIAGVALLMVAILVGLSGFAIARRRPFELRMDPSGVTSARGAQAPWADIDFVRLTPLFPALPVNFARSQVAAFVPLPGRTLPPGPSVPTRGLLGRLGHWMRMRRYGSDLILPLSAMDIAQDDFIAAVERLGGKNVVVQGPAWRRR